MCSPTLIDAPVKPMLAMWCWPQPLGQPLILTCIARVSGSSIAHRLEPLADREVEPHRAGDAELAAVGARAGDDVVDLVVRRVAEAECAQSACQTSYTDSSRTQRRTRFCCDGRARVAAGEVAHDLRRARGTARGSGRRAGSCTSTVTKPAWRCARVLAATKRSNSRASPLGDRVGAGAARARRPPRRRRRAAAVGSKSRSATQSPRSSSSTISRKASMPMRSTSTLMRARARFARSSSWRLKIRSTASVTLRYSPSSAPTNS